MLAKQMAKAMNADEEVKKPAPEESEEQGKKPARAQESTGEARQGPAGQQAAEEEGGEPVTEEEQEAIDRVVAAAGKILYGKETHQDVMKTLKDGAENPGQVLATTTMNMMQLLDEKAGGKIPELALVQGAIQVLELLAELAEAAGIFAADEQTMASAAQNLMAVAIEQGIIDPAEIEGMMNEMPPEQVQQIVAQQEQIAMGGQNAVAG